MNDKRVFCFMGSVALCICLMIGGVKIFLPLSSFLNVHCMVETIGITDGGAAEKSSFNGILDKWVCLNNPITDMKNAKMDLGDALDRKNYMDSTIRVLIKSSGFTFETHNYLEFKCNADMELAFRKDSAEQYLGRIQAGECYRVEAKDFGENETGKLLVRSADEHEKISVVNLQRSSKAASYGGTLEVWKKGDSLILINEIPIEQYLYGVLPSEMSSEFPVEALKAQAICARTYIYNKRNEEAYGKYHAHADDSTSFQVYNNVDENERCKQAVDETCGIVLYAKNGELAQTYYYSTSCGYGSDGSVWGEEDTFPYIKSKRICKGAGDKNLDRMMEGCSDQVFDTFLKVTNPEDFEYDEPWYRWKCEVRDLDIEELKQRLCDQYQKDPSHVVTKKGFFSKNKKIPDFHEVKNMEITSRGAGGIAEELTIETDQGKIRVIKEKSIRYILNNGSLEVKRQDGTSILSTELLPSAFICLETKKAQNKVIGYSILGGGFGHGVGLSQNAAKHMAEEGYDCNSILEFFYDGCRTGMMK